MAFGSLQQALAHDEWTPLPVPVAPAVPAVAAVPAPAVFANTAGQRATDPAVAAAPLETSAQRSARLAQEKLLTGTGGYVDPGTATFAPEGATTNQGLKPGQAGYTESRNMDAYMAQMDANVASGNILPGEYSGQHNASSSFHPELSWDEANAKRERDFGLGAANNAQTAAMIGQAQATGNKYSAAFGGTAATAGAAQAAAAARGTDIYNGNTSAYAQGLTNAQQSRDMQTGAYQGLLDLTPKTDPYAALMAFSKAPEGPSAAQAQLNQATDANMANTLSLARSGRGMGGGAAAMRQAIGQNAGIQQQAANQSAALRAQEYQAYQQNKLGALGTAGSQAAQAAQTRLGALSAAGGVAGQTVASDQSYGQLGLAGAQYQTDTALKGTQLNDAAAQGWADRQNAALQQGMASEVGAQTQGLNINSTALTGRENAESSAAQEYGINQGLALQSSITDANRQQAYLGAGLNAAGTVMGALSDERTKTNIMPLGGDLSGNGVAPLPSQSGNKGGASFAMPSMPDAGAAAEQRKQATGGAVGGAAGSVVGGAAGSTFGPVGTVVGSALGNIAGKAIGKIFSDVRSKTNIRPLDQENPYGGGFASGSLPRPRELDTDAFGQLQALSAKYGASGVAESPKAVSEYTALKPGQQKGFESWLKKNDVRDLDHPDSHYDYRGAYQAGEGRGTGDGHFTDRFKQHGHPTFSTQSQYSAGPKDGGDWVDDTYLPQAPQGAGAATARRFAKADHPILSEGDALLADSARNAPVSSYEYKNPGEPGAKPGVQVGQMAQDLAAHPVTAGMVGKDPKSGKLYVDGGRAAMTSLAQNHGQQKHIDALSARIGELENMLPDSLKRKKGDASSTSFPLDQYAGGL